MRTVIALPIDIAEGINKIWLNVFNRWSLSDLRDYYLLEVIRGTFFYILETSLENESNCDVYACINDVTSSLGVNEYDKLGQEVRKLANKSHPIARQLDNIVLGAPNIDLEDVLPELLENVLPTSKIFLDVHLRCLAVYKKHLGNDRIESIVISNTGTTMVIET